MPFLETVAGDALSMSLGSNTILTVVGKLSLSPFASVKILESSKTELRFSIHMGSTGPSRTSQKKSPFLDFIVFLHRAAKMPSHQSLVATSSLPNICGAVMDFGLSLYSLCGWPRAVSPPIRVWIHLVFPAPLGPRTIMPCLTL